MLTSLASVLFLSISMALSPVPVMDDLPEARVIAYALNVREEPMGKVIGSLYLGDTVSIVDDGNGSGWYLVAREREELGWVSGKWLSFGDTQETYVEVRDALLECDSQCWPSIDTYKTPAPKHITGNAVMYAPGLMEATAKYRGMDLTGFMGGVAMPSMADMGQVVWLRRAGMDWEGPYLVVDVSQRAHMWEHIVLKGQSVEVDFETAVRWGMATGGASNWRMLHGRLDSVEVFKGLQPPDETSVAVNYREHFLRTATLGQAGQSVYWSNAMAEFTNYAEYERALNDDNEQVVQAEFVEVDTMALRLREQPDLSARILTVLHRGDVVPVLDRQGRWIQVQFAQFTGWLHGDYVKQANMPDPVQGDDDIMVMLNVDNVDCTDDDPYNGYYYRGDCIPGVITEDSYRFEYPPAASGYAVYYDKGVMTQVSNRFNMQGYKGGVALMSCEEIGRAVWLQISGVVDGPYLVTDCTRDYGMFKNLGYNEIVVEVGWNTYQSFVERGLWNGYATVCFQPDCNKGVWLSDYWLNMVEFQSAQAPAETP